jgi:methyltransferase (TIGR00027 family)
VPERGERRLARGQASDTAEINAAMRAVERTRPEDRRLFDDPYAHHFVRRPLYRAVTRVAPVGRLASALLDRWMPGLTGEVILRNRYWDDALDEALAGGVTQVVLLGAGYDSTALRRELGDGVTVYEVDSPPTQEAKRAALERSGLAPRVVFVPCDFEVHAVGERLGAVGFDRSERAVVCWLGVSFYLTAEGLRGALEDLAALSAPGSRLVMDYLDQGVTAGTTPYAGAARAARSVERRGEPYHSGFDEPGFARLLAEAGFDVVDHARVEDLVDRYLGGGAWCRTDDWLRVATAVRRG